MDNSTNPMNTGGAVNVPPADKKKAVGPLIGLIVILAIIIIGGIYFWGSRLNPNPSQNEINNTTNENQYESGTNVETILNQDSSDEIASIEDDLNSFNEADIEKISSEL